MGLKYNKILDTIRFPLKVWLTSVLLSPILYLLIINLGGYRDHYAALFNAWGFYAVAVVIGGLVSIPNWLLLWVCYYFVNKTKWALLTKKLALCAFSVLLTVLLFRWNFSELDSISRGDYITAISYMVTVAVGCLVYKVDTVSPHRQL
ncbi:hypothetical protein CPT03_19040 [Pedobacter ginsengisoli]|uniref:Uncharacterized protein n=1 Tax=Pedobacter ginsengisoli TaxID=363852 RepID=A0A2D1U9W4_9SPHI|nr:hypothetical protein [Pedobacter ginsengisoli]ATP58407.1 hypothetical protein CPT03_19040 [Pedobacter ginsengisoli]